MFNTAIAVDSAAVSGADSLKIRHGEIARAALHLQIVARQFHLDLALSRPSNFGDAGAIHDFVVRVQVLDHLLKRLAEIVGVGDQKSAGAFGQGAQAGLPIRGPHGRDGVVTLRGCSGA